MIHSTQTGVPWWKRAVIYQVYPRSFQDSNGDGIGDIPGIISRLDYLAELGIDAIWLSPVYCSPQDDNGYDISDYRDIDPIFGTLADMDRLIREAGDRGIRIIMDLVLNHSSDEHRWFREAKKSRDNPWHDFYIWRDGTEGTPPTDQRASFGGSAWEWVPELGQYYFHQFSVKQPDLNWDDPAMRRELYDMIRWWADRGVGGFRLDVVDHLSKDPDTGWCKNGPHLHEIIRELRREAFQKPDLVTVGEAWSADIPGAKLYSDPGGSELSMVFQFRHILLDQQPGKEKWDTRPLPLPELKQVMSQWQTELYGAGWNSLFWENHDLPRIVSRWGDDGAYRVPCAKMLGILLHGMQGTPYIYQGQELGMTNAPYPIEDYRDIEALNMYRERTARGVPPEEVMASLHARARDNARTPMQWTDGENAGFTQGTPWMRVNPNHREINATSQVGDENSVFSCYRRLIRLRKELPVLVEGRFRLLLPEDEHIFAYTREDGEKKLLVVCSFSGEEIACPLQVPAEAELLACSWSDGGEPGRLRPWEGRMYLMEARDVIVDAISGEEY